MVCGCPCWGAVACVAMVVPRCCRSARFLADFGESGAPANKGAGACRCCLEWWCEGGRGVGDKAKSKGSRRVALAIPSFNASVSTLLLTAEDVPGPIDALRNIRIGLL